MSLWGELFIQGAISAYESITRTLMEHWLIDRLVVTPRLHHRIRKDIQEARHLLKMYEEIRVSLDVHSQYIVEQRPCSEQGSTTIHNTLLKIYKKFHVIIWLLRQGTSIWKKGLYIEDYETESEGQIAKKVLDTWPEKISKKSLKSQEKS